MSPTRREFIQGMALIMASLALARCAPGGEDDDSPRGRLRSCWRRLDQLAREAKKDDAKGETLRQQLVADHQGALDELVAAGEVGAAAAQQMQAAFVEAAFHVWRANIAATCYEPMEFSYTPQSADQLVKQADLLAEMAAEGELDPDTVAQARAAITRDVAFLALSDEQLEALYARLREAAQGGEPIPALEALDLEIPPEAAESALYLVTLLTENPER